jgi:hypothetical protein
MLWFCEVRRAMALRGTEDAKYRTKWISDYRAFPNCDVERTSREGIGTDQSSRTDPSYVQTDLEQSQLNLSSEIELKIMRHFLLAD